MRATRIWCSPPAPKSRPVPRAPRWRGTGPSHGLDVDDDGNGTLREGRLYHFVRQHDAIRERTLEITFLEAGVEAYCSH